MDGQTSQLKSTGQGKRNSQLQDLQGQEGGGKRLWNLNEPTGHHGAKAKGCQRHCVYMCAVAQHAEDTPGWPERVPTPGNDVTAQQYEQVVYMPNENYRNPLREASQQQELLKDYFITWGHWLGRRTGSEM